MTTISLRDYGYSCKSCIFKRRQSLLDAIKETNIQIVYNRLKTIIGYGNPKKEMLEDFEWLTNFMKVKDASLIPLPDE